MFVEAHTVGEDDWTTLPDANGNTSQDTGSRLPRPDDPFWLDENPFLKPLHHPRARRRRPTCAPTGTSGAWNAATGNSAGFQDWNVDLTPYAGKQVEVSITYASDPGTQGLGVFVDDTKVTADGATVSDDVVRGRSSAAGRCPARPPESGTNANDWERHAVRRLRRRPGRRDRPLALLGLRPRGRGRPRQAGPADGRRDALLPRGLARSSHGDTFEGPPPGGPSSLRARRRGGASCS